MTINPKTIKDYAVPSACLCVVMCAFIVVSLVNKGLSTLQETRDLARTNAGVMREFEKKAEKQSSVVGKMNEKLSSIEIDVAILKSRTERQGSILQIPLNTVAKNKHYPLLLKGGDG